MPIVALKDMAHSMEDAKEEIAESTYPQPVDKQPKYPYGLSISLGEDELEKLGIRTEDGKLDLPEVGDIISLVAAAKVTSVSSREEMSGEVCCRVELQITHLGLGEDMF